ncbi:extracellular catalytic domain type 1 short-chain-length polyhydroxyalkanoate depolymerase [Cognatilysobacter lacus]|uniref:Prolyl oligopeptidase family serine peptidase n=1 Tax=Cognatilysobacter lacus TaxID=1643323 RepID=A0A5D8Z759_9GAMM|nr:PHB depolymerase family esterase [Lysobacter lacus]TZF90376.1 prolyl oligopeptidase family serine peptidase [Lysobacter lacus]
MKRLVLPLCVAACAAAFAHAQDGGLRAMLRARMAQRPADTVVAIGADPSTVITRPGDYRFDIRHDGLMRAYRVHVPRAYRPGRATPLLVALHGGGGDMDWQADDSKYGLIGKSEQAGFIVVFPNGYSRFASGRLATWNAGACCGGARDAAVDDVGFIRDVVGHVQRQLDVDRTRIFATGMSNGGMMAYRLACDASDLFRAVAPVAGTDNTLDCRPARPVSIAHVHARNDDHVLFGGGAGASAFPNANAVTDFASVPATIAKWSSLVGCHAPARRVLQRPGAYCDLQDDCRGGAKVQLCVTETGGHSWPGGHKDRGEPASQAISANDVMWSFFESLPQRRP